MYLGNSWQGLMILHQQRKYGSYEVDRVCGNFLATPDGIKVSIHAFHAEFEP